MFAYFPADLIRNDKCSVLQLPLLSYEIPQSQSLQEVSMQ